MKREESYSKYKELFRSETREYLAQLNQYIINLEKKPEEIETIDAIFRNYHTIKGMAGTMGYKIIESLSHSLEDLLSLIKNGKLSVDSNIIDLMLEGTDKIELMIENPKMENEEIQALIMRISDIKEGKGLAQDAEKKLEIKARIAKKSDIRVEIKKLDNLQNLLSELVIAKESLKRVVRSDERESIFNETDRISNIVSALQDEVVRIRMVPIWQIFERFPRVVRDTAKEMGKKIDFEIRGKDIELDRSMLENLAEPLIHLLRNSIYHGIEMPEERKRLGKLEEGHLILEASRQKGIVLIKVSDDGSGMDTQRILSKAIEGNFVEPEKAKSLSEKEILGFIFISGFSTSRVVDEVSGRGVGLDVVKTRLRTLGGTFDFKTEKNKGTTFILKIPLTMAIIKAFLVNIGKETFAIPLTFVEETIELDKRFIKSIHSKEIFILRDEVIPIKRLHKIFGIQDGDKMDYYSTVIVNSESKKAALIASEFLEHTDIVVKTLPRTQSDIKEFAGVTILSDGKPALIIDVPNIV